MENQASDIHGDLGHVISYQDQSQLGEVTLQQTVNQPIPVDDGSVVLGYPENEEGGPTTYIIRFVDGNVASYQQETQMQVQHMGGETVYQPIESLVTDPGTSQAIRLAEKVLNEQCTDTSAGDMDIGAAQEPRSHSHVTLVNKQEVLVAGAGNVTDASRDIQPATVTPTGDGAAPGHVKETTTGVGQVREATTGVGQVREATTCVGQVRETTTGVGQVREATTGVVKEEVTVGVANTRTRRVIKKPPKLKDFDSSDGRKSQKVIRLPTMTKTNLDVHDLFIEIEIGHGLFVGQLERTPLNNGNSKFKFRISKQKFKGLCDSEAGVVAAESVSVAARKQDTKVSTSPVKSVAKSQVKISAKSPLSNNSGKLPVKESPESPVQASTRSSVSNSKSIIRTRNALREEKRESKSNPASESPATPRSMATRKQTALAKQTGSSKAQTPLKVETPSRGRGRSKKIVQESTSASSCAEQDQTETDKDEADNLEPVEDVPTECVEAGGSEDNAPAENYTESDELQAALNEFQCVEGAAEGVTVKVEDTEAGLGDMGADSVEDMDIGDDVDAEVEDIIATIKKKTPKKPKKKRKRDEDDDDDDDENNDGEQGSVRKRTYTRRNIYNKTEQNYTVRKTEDGRKLLVCADCEYQTHSYALIHEHISVHSDLRPVPCPQCDKGFKNKKALRLHMIRHREKTIECDTCGMLFCTGRELITHHSVHTQDRRFKCSVCPAAFNHSSSLSKHKHIHRRQGQGPDLDLDHLQHICHMCGELYSRREDMKRHMAFVHDCPIHYKCDMCPRVFDDSTGLLQHKASHSQDAHSQDAHSQEQGENDESKDRAFKCYTCPQSFNNKADLIRHKHTHSLYSPKHFVTDDQKFECKICGQKFSHSSSLARHKHKHVEDRYKNTCHVCGAQFFRADGLIRHKATVHSDMHEPDGNIPESTQINIVDVQLAEIGFSRQTSQTVKTDTNVGDVAVSLSTGIRSDSSGNVEGYDQHAGVMDVFDNVVTPEALDMSIRPDN